jgi:hypothetical protein
MRELLKFYLFLEGRRREDVEARCFEEKLTGLKLLLLDGKGLRFFVDGFLEDTIFLPMEGDLGILPALFGALGFFVPSFY